MARRYTQKHRRGGSKGTRKHVPMCKRGMSFNDCELEVLRQAVDHIEKEQGKKVIMSAEVQEIIGIVEEFLVRKKLVCYGGTAINNILPVDDQFYDKEIEIPDYDFFSPNALHDAKELADIYFKRGFTDVEAKAGVHHGTYKVFVNFIPVADITSLPRDLFNNIQKDAIRIAGIYYASPDYLRMAMYLELSRPKGDVSRWEKVFKRLTLLNKNYPLKGSKCSSQHIQREMDADIKKVSDDDENKLFFSLRDTFINQGLVFFGALANKMYLQYTKEGRKLKNIPDFDILADDPEKAALIAKERLEADGFKHVTTKKRAGVGEIVAPHYELRVDGETVAFIYEPLGCHSYNIVEINGKKARIATIDTMLSFYLAFMYAGLPYHDANRILCMSEYLFKVQEQNRLEQKGILRRFTMDCYGEQITLDSNRKAKSAMFQKLKKNRNSKEYEEWFLRYIPAEIHAAKVKQEEEKKSGAKAKTSRAPKKSSRTKTQKKSRKKFLGLF